MVNNPKQFVNLLFLDALQVGMLRLFTEVGLLFRHLLTAGSRIFDRAALAHLAADLRAT